MAEALSNLLNRWRPRPLREGPGALRAGIAVLALAAAFAAGISGLVLPSWYAPLFVVAGVVAAAIAVTWWRRPVWALYAAFAVVLLPDGLLPTLVQSYLNRSLTLIALGTWLLSAIIRRRRIRWTSTSLLMLGFLIWGATTLLWAIDVDIAKDALARYALRWILYFVLVANQINSREALGRLLGALALSGWVLVLAGVATLLSAGYQAGTRLTVLTMNENGYGVLVLTTMPGVLWQGMRKPKRWGLSTTLMRALFILLAMVLVAMSGSRGSAISLAVTLLAFWLWKPTRVWGKASLLILALAVAGAPLIFSTTARRFALETGDTLLGGREVLWQGAWQLIRDRPWQGVGIGGAPSAMVPYALAARNVLENGRAPIHNPLLTIWAETAIPGLALYLGVLGSAIWRFVREWRRSVRMGAQALSPYYALVSSVFAGFMFSWFKGGGAEGGYTYFLMLALLLIPSLLDREALAGAGEDAQSVPVQARTGEST